MSQKNSFQRLFVILKRLNEGKTLCVNEIANEFEVSDRTVRRDFELIKETWGNFLTKTGSSYKAYNKTILSDVLKGSDLSTLVSAIKVVEAGNFKFKADKSLKVLIDKSKNIYSFKTKPFEEVKNKDIVSSLEIAISYKQKIEVFYTTATGDKVFYIDPYKIIFINENFYVAGAINKKDPFILLRISLIKKINVLQDTFYIKRDLELFINNKIQTPWSKFNPGKDDMIIVVEVDKSILKYFEMKKYLPSQKIGHLLDNGNTTIFFTVTTSKEFHELAIKWMPKMKILSPQKVKSSIKKELLSKLSGL